MSSALLAPSPSRFADLAVPIGLVLAAGIAWLAPFDPLFNAVTLGSPALRAAAIVTLALVGLKVGQRIGLGIEARGFKRPVLASLGIAAAVGVGCALADWLLSPDRHSPLARYMLSTSLAVRLGSYIMRAFNENIMYRLFLGSVLVWAIGQVWKTAEGRPATGAYWAGFLLAQALNIWINVVSLAPITAHSLLHDAVRYVTPGMVWAWLYWRHGFQCNEIACTSVHLIYQPLVPLGFR